MTPIHRTAADGKSHDKPSTSDVGAILPHSENTGPVFRRHIRKIHSHGPRIVGELVAEMARRLDAPAWLDQRLQLYANIDQGAVDFLNCADWPAELTPVPVNKRRAA